jgi:AcrR family transcriptional regulator
MARPSTIREEQILEVARRLFIERGYGVSTAEIAKELGISEGSIFKRFCTKQKLLMAALGLSSHRRLEPIADLVGQKTVTENIALLLQEGIAMFREMMPRMMTLWAVKEISPEELHSDPDSPPRKVLRALTEYFAKEEELGRVFVEDPEIPARMVMGAVANYVFVRMMGLTQMGHPLAAEDYAEAVAQTLWYGLAPRAPKSSDAREKGDAS